MTPHRFVLCDVFTDKALQGQSLAVFTRATGLSDEHMQSLARELNASETAFVQPPLAGGHAKVRVFDSASEVSEPGHSVLGTAVVLGGALQAEEVRLETRRGMLSVRLEREGARIVFGWIHEQLPSVAPYESARALEAALGLGQPLGSSDVSESAPGHLVVAADLDKLLELAPDRQVLARMGVDRLCMFAGDRGRYWARVFAPGAERFELPVAPASAGLVAAHLLCHDREAPDASFSIESDARLPRPWLVHVRCDGPAASRVAVGGAAVVVGRGEVVF